MDPAIGELDPPETQPCLHTSRLRLRPFVPDDTPSLASLAGERAIADTTISIPHPYTPELAAAWIGSHFDDWAQRRAVHYAIEPLPDPQLLGGISLRAIDENHRQAEIGFWIGHPFWGQGYATEAVLAAVQFAFDRLRLNRVYAHHMTRNPASGRVLVKAGFQPEGLMRQRVIKWGHFEDVLLYSVLSRDPLPAILT